MKKQPAKKPIPFSKERRFQISLKNRLTPIVRQQKLIRSELSEIRAILSTMRGILSMLDISDIQQTKDEMKSEMKQMGRDIVFMMQKQMKEMQTRVNTDIARDNMWNKTKPRKLSRHP